MIDNGALDCHLPVPSFTDGCYVGELTTASSPPIPLCLILGMPILMLTHTPIPLTTLAKPLSRHDGVAQRTLGAPVVPPVHTQIAARQEAGAPPRIHTGPGGAPRRTA